MTPSLSISLGLAINALMAWEMIRAPWSPFFWITALLILAIPLLNGTMPMLLGQLQWGHSWFPMLLVLGGTLAWEIGLCTFFYENIFLQKYFRYQDPFWSPTAAINTLFNKTSSTSIAWQDLAVGTFFVLLWAPFAEELFYCGFLYFNTHESFGYIPSIILIGFLFATRHAIQLIPIRPFPWPASIVFAISAWGSLALNFLLLKVTRSLFPLMLVHLVSNLAWECLYYFRRPSTIGDPI